MAIMKKGATATVSTLSKDQNKIKPKPQTKQEISLKTLLDAGREGINTYQANARYGDTCLHSMISIFRNNFSLLITDKYEDITNRAGGKVPTKRYWLIDDNSVKSAKKLIDNWRIKRGAPPLYQQPINEEIEGA